MSGRTRDGSAMSASRSASESPGSTPGRNRLSSAPVSITTSAPASRSPSACAAQSASSASSASSDTSFVNGQSHTASPASAERVAAIFNRSASPPVTRTAVQCRSSRMTRISRRTRSGSNGSCVLVPALKKPVS